MIKNVKYIDFKEIEKGNNDLKGISEEISKIYIDGTLFINTAFKGEEGERLFYNIKTGELEKDNKCNGKSRNKLI